MTTAREPAPSLSTEPQDFESATMPKVSRRQIPFLFLLYVAAYLDRINVGFGPSVCHSHFM
jgi:hypothetical protein